jgi:hypothetical protein
MARRTHYTVYGTVAHTTSEGKRYPHSVTKDFDEEGDAWAYIIILRTKGWHEHNYVLVRTMAVTRDDRAYGKWKNQHEILLRVGKGKAWYE